MSLLAAYAASHLLISDQLRNAPLFDALPRDRGECFAVLRQGAVYDVPAYRPVVAVGDEPALIVVTRGCVGDPISHQSWQEGCYLGAAESLALQPFAAAISTLAPSRLYRLDGALLRLLMRSCPAIADRIRADLPTPLPRPALHGAD
jgi:hypothetical protein